MRSPTITYQGITATVAEHARRCGIDGSLVNFRLLKYGRKDLRRIFAKPRPRQYLVTDPLTGRTDTLANHAKRIGKSLQTIREHYRRHRKGRMSLEDVFKPVAKFGWGRIWTCKITFDGITDTPVGWGRRIGVSPFIVLRRFVKHGAPYVPYGGVVQPLGSRFDSGFVTYRGQTLSVPEWSRRTGVQAQAIYRRLRQGATPAQAFYRGKWANVPPTRVEAQGNHTRRKLAALGIFA